ncbi:MAG: YafY family protein [Pricia sp.]
MAEDKPRLARLTAILTQLQSKRLVTAKEIADKHHVSIRTIYRDIRTLEKSGVPVITEEGKGYSIMEGYTLPPVLFTEEEANALITAEQLINQNKDASLSVQYQNAVQKIKSVLRHSQKEKTELLASRLQVRNNPSNEQTSHDLVRLQSTITDYRLVRIDYASAEGRESRRDVEPFALYTTQDNWILIAFCRQKNDFRAFRLDRIRQLLPLDRYFAPHNMTLPQYLEKCREKYKHP